MKIFLSPVSWSLQLSGPAGVAWCNAAAADVSPLARAVRREMLAANIGYDAPAPRRASITDWSHSQHIAGIARMARITSIAGIASIEPRGTIYNRVL